ncbi:MAG: electron transfer flavoprotein subunit alpha/FixB family protein [Flavobacteriales bacterium]|jgi:electron transfer flavoprotein alpha subunit|nr:electron transfer flavoprotein subunit alpha/FixB family protein [Flavobacteriales bacterium]NCG30163.1 electron transfer flavoprotein subunit alpha/FixB family protein [Bacteroidota bacterium]MBT3962909.1 electron transfer flavoprotein subunit alpha/FixB family protein [Flavobacteriales bacterium]MBT4705277.1 electron transfer flavoprotein subunit alpha/FixB family protein [Flavobacteriales bacterium]MBT4930897.1 electron transfer flavoprotein subunit alpha/FixB family protein [Flavobacteri
MKVLVFADSSNGKVAKSAFEAVTYGKKIADQSGGSQTTISYGQLEDSELDELASYGSGEILHYSGDTEMDPLRLAKLVSGVATDQGYEVIVFSHDYTGKSIAPMTAAKLRAGLVTGAIDYPKTDGGFTVKKAVFSGKAFAEVKINSTIKVISLLPNSISKEKNGATKNVSAISPDLGAHSVNVVEFKAKGGEGINLTEAELVVSAGRGLKGPENWGMIEELASELGAATACSRPVADIGWRPHHEHVGQTGIAIRPNLYIAVGISGAIQHLAGVNGSKVIVVVNTDSEAPFFTAADYGVVGDAFEVIPKLLDALKAHNAAQA